MQLLVLQVDEKKRILMKLGEIGKYIEELEEILPTEEDYNHNLTIRRACEKTIELALEALISIISLIVARERLGFPEDEDNLITLLQKKQLLSTKMCITLKAMKGFRNILVHKYGEIDNEQAYEFLSNNLEDFNLFEREVKKYLGTKK